MIWWFAACTPEDSDTDLLAWAPCDGGFRCGSVIAADGAEIEVVRHDAVPPSDTTAVLATGGPGSSSIDLLRVLIGAWAIYDPQLWAGMNWVAMDNRGVGATDPVDCVGDDWFDDLRVRDPVPASAADEDGLLASAAAFREGCLADRSVGDLLALGTSTYADDLDAVRAAVGADTIHFLGFSYGTWIGAVYATRYPEHVGRFVLDGVVGPGRTRDLFLEGQAAGFERALERFFDRCNADPTCVLDDPAGAFDTLAQQADAAPLPAPSDPDGRSLSGNELRFAVATLLYGPNDVVLAEGLAEALAGDATLLLSSADGGWGRDASGAYDPAYQGYFAIGCADTPWPEGWTAEDVWAFAGQLSADYPRLGGAITTGELTCLDWPVAAPAPSLASPSTPPFLLVAGRNDPATPYANATALADAVGNDPFLLSYEGDGHVAMFVDVSGCAYEQERTFLLEGVPPRADACPYE